MFAAAAILSTAFVLGRGLALIEKSHGANNIQIQYYIEKLKTGLSLQNQRVMNILPSVANKKKATSATTAVSQTVSKAVTSLTNVKIRPDAFVKPNENEKRWIIEGPKANVQKPKPEVFPRVTIEHKPEVIPRQHKDFRDIIIDHIPENILLRKNIIDVIPVEQIPVFGSNIELLQEKESSEENKSNEEKGGSGSDIDRIRKVAQQSYDYAVNNPRQSGLNRMQLGKDAEVQATRWTRKWAERNGIDLSEEGLHFQVRGNHSIPDVVYEPTHSIMDFKLTPKAIRKIQSDNFKLDFLDYFIEYIFGPGPWRDN